MGNAQCQSTHGKKRLRVATVQIDTDVKEAKGILRYMRRCCLCFLCSCCCECDPDAERDNQRRQRVKACVFFCVLPCFCPHVAEM